jgi:hypothetical protein
VWHELNLSLPGQGQLASSCEHGNESLDFINFGEFPDSGELLASYQGICCME